MKSVLRSPHQFTVEDYHRMGEAGILTAGDRTELINGEIIAKSVIGSRHAARVDRLNKLFVTRCGERAIVRVQKPVTLPPDSEPEPDLLLLLPKADFYAAAHPQARDVLLAVEVADSSLRFDSTVKCELYARMGIAEYWLVDLSAGALLVYRSNAAGAYQAPCRLRTGSIVPLALPEVSFDVGDIAGEP